MLHINLAEKWIKSFWPTCCSGDYSDEMHKEVLVYIAGLWRKWQLDLKKLRKLETTIFMASYFLVRKHLNNNI